MRYRRIAIVCAVLSAYAAVVALRMGCAVLVGPMAASFIACAFCASLLEENFDEAVEEEGDVLHAASLISLARFSHTTPRNKDVKR